MVRPEVVLIGELHHQEQVVRELYVRPFDRRVELLPQSAGLVDHQDGHGERQFDQEPVHQEGDREDAGRAVAERKAFTVQDKHFGRSGCLYQERPKIDTVISSDTKKEELLIEWLRLTAQFVFFAAKLDLAVKSILSSAF